jgi:hypothetical protein
MMHKPIEEKQVILGQMQLQANVALHLLSSQQPLSVVPVSGVEKQARNEAARFLRDLMKQRPGM